MPPAKRPLLFLGILLLAAPLGRAPLCFPWYNNFTRICTAESVEVEGNTSSPSTLLGFDLPFDEQNYAPCGYSLSVTSTDSSVEGHMRISSSIWFDPSATTIFQLKNGTVTTPWFGDKGDSSCSGVTSPGIVYIDVALTQLQTKQAMFVIKQTSGVWPGVPQQFGWDGTGQAGQVALYPVGRLPAGWSSASLTANATTSNSACYWDVAFGQFVDGKPSAIYSNRTHLCSETGPMCKANQQYTAHADGKGVVAGAQWFIRVTGGQQYLGVGTDCYVTVGVSTTATSGSFTLKNA